MTDTMAPNARLISNPEKPCKCCAKPMPQAATFCTHCENHQSWFRRNISFGETTLALMVALVAVVGAAVPPIVSLFDKPDSSLRQTSVVVADGALKVVMANAGDRAGVFQLARVLFRAGKDEPAALVNFEVGGNPIVAASEMKAYTLKPSDPVSRDGVPKDIVLDLQARDFANQQEAVLQGTQPQPLKCDIVFQTISFLGSENTETVQSRCLTIWLSLFPGDRPEFQEAQKALESAPASP